MTMASFLIDTGEGSNLASVSFHRSTCTSCVNRGKIVNLESGIQHLIVLKELIFSHLQIANSRIRVCFETVYSLAVDLLLEVMFYSSYYNRDFSKKRKLVSLQLQPADTIAPATTAQNDVASAQNKKEPIFLLRGQRPVPPRSSWKASNTSFLHKYTSFGD